VWKKIRCQTNTKHGRSECVQSNGVIYVHQKHLINENKKYVTNESIEVAAGNSTSVQALGEVTEKNQHESNESQDSFP
jgi:hypothetical protein